MTKPHTFLTTPRHLCLWLGLINVPMSAMAITWTNQQPADLVLGQASFTTNASGTANNALNNGPAGMAVDPTTSKVFIADINNHRVLRFASLNSLTNGATAEAVLGTTGTSGCSPNTFRNPSMVIIDSSGYLWVSDHNNSRILRFDNAATIASGANASAVLGQPNFTTCPNPGPVTQNGIDRPCSLTIDSGGHLWVTLCYSNRVLRFDNAASKANGANADGVLGQANFTSSGSGLSATTMNVPTAITIDAAGNLYLMDANNRRVLRFNSAASKANGATADLVLGQPNFTSNGAAITQTGMNPYWNGGVAVDNSTGQVFVGDTQNHRVLIYSNPTTNGIAASYVLGQPNFTSATANNGGISASSLNGPRGLFFDPTTTSLLVADMWNNRILRYAPPEIQILDGATDLPLNGTLNLGTTNVGSPIYKNLTIKNLGNGNLNLTGSPIVSVTGTGFAAATSPAASIAPANPSTFILQFNPGTVGNFTGSLSIVNNDSDENPFILSLQGTAVGLPQTLTFTLPTVATVGDAPLALSATATSGLPVTLASTTPGVCTVSGTTLTIVTAGTCTVTADQAGNALYLTAPQVTANLIINPLPRPNLKVRQSATDIPAGGSFNVGPSGIGHHVHFTLTIDNTGNSDLLLNGTPKIQVSGNNAGEFSVDETATASPLTGGSSTTFLLTFIPSSLGTKTATLTLMTNDARNPNYSFTVTGSAEPHKNLQITVTGTGQGSVTSDPTGMDCETALRVCSMPVIDAPQWVTLTAVPATGSEFIGWTGDAACQTNGQVLVITDTACTATFGLKSYQLTGNFLGKGRVTGPGIDCPGQCTATYLYGTTVTLTAQATRKMWNFSGWRGCDSQGNIQITNEVLCQAVFTPDPNIPNAGDGNGDGQLDAYQDNVVSLPDKVTGTYLTLETQPATCVISDIYPDLAEAQTIKLDHTKKFPQGMLYFDIVCPQAQVSVYYHGMSKLSRNLKFYKFGPKIPGDLTTIAWYQLPNIKYELVTIGGKSVVKGTYTLKDGELGDSTGVDGHIVDPGGLVYP